jgi:pyruvate formate lyase activating enzyme
VTNGYMTEGALTMIGPYLDAANVDVKGFNDRTYKEISKVDNPEEVLARCEEMVKRWKIHIEITTNVIPGYNDRDETFRGIAEWIVTKLGPMVPWHITRYHPANRLDIPPTPLDTMIRGREIGRKKGLKFIYLGNIPDPEGDGTDCPSCGRVVIERRGFSTGKINVEKSKCGFCGEEMGIKQ